ncbi:MAG TPA: hypothetical protein PKM27_08775 [Saprospiraceae bacterium]|nr:hypothetical protein [Saprospiraceae bacterium]HNT19527.1 hypothetical protein [Saprospiraceae bacterium]
MISGHVFHPFYSIGLLILAALFNCQARLDKTARVYKSSEQVTGYHFAKPDQVLELPASLHEISGIAVMDSTTLACIQDEKGIVYIFNSTSGQIINQYSFYGQGDFEDIAKFGNAMYILRSDATLFEIADFSGEPAKAISYGLNIPAYDNEGLCYDAGKGRLLIASKGNSGKGEELKNRRDLYAFDLETKSLVEPAVVSFDERVIKKFALEKVSGIPMKEKKSGEKEPDIKLRPTAIGIHPLTRQFFLLSAPDYMLFIFSADWTLEHLELLDPALFNQAEGLAFYDNGDLLISNEGQDKKATLLRFNYKK